ncbi:GIY-YIG nuclease family protein [Streptomyces sp. NPDC058045]|uniref:GIY-YIG nuclease family protein n=1 Tax=Streptomyces sp. NPDC058045 TaxID=3346311 RepID=UPI0036DFE779
MNDHEIPPTCTANDEGRPCPREATVLRPVALCHAHCIEIALTAVSELLCNELDAALRGSATAPAVRNDVVEASRAVTVDDLLHGVHSSVVYFVANGSRVKIGYTTNLKSRLAALALRSDSVLLTLQGGPELERALHRRFSAYRNGDTEWFEMSPEIFRYISTPRGAATGGNAPALQSALPSIADLVREQVQRTETNTAAVAAVMQLRPDANRDSVSAAVRRARRQHQMRDGYA